jgi:prophage regulatory protein
MVISILRMPEVRKRTGLARSTIYLRISQHRFPQPISLGGKAVGWRSDEIDAWIEDQTAVSNRGE